MATKRGDARERDDTDRTGSYGLTAREAAEAGLEEISVIVAKRAEGVISVTPTDDGWTVMIEMLENRHVPSTADVLGLYEVELDVDGRLLSYRRARRYIRGRGDEGAV